MNINKNYLSIILFVVEKMKSSSDLDDFFEYRVIKVTKIY